MDGVETNGDDQTVAGMEPTKKCPKCAEPVRAGAAVCRFCGYDFESGSFVQRPNERTTSRYLVVGTTIVGLIAIAIVGAIVWSSNNAKTSDEPAPRDTYPMKGTLAAPECGGGYDIEFVSVEVRDQNDKLIGSGTTGVDETVGSGCEVSWEVEVPKATFYQVTVGTHGGPSYSFDEMEAIDWNLDLTLGS